MYIQYQDCQFFLPFRVNCSQVAVFQIMPALCLYRQGEGGWSTKCRQAWRGGGGSQKFPNLCEHPLWMTPIAANIQPSEKVSSYPTGAAGSKPMIPWPYKKSLKMRPVPFSLISTLLEVADLS